MGVGSPLCLLSRLRPLAIPSIEPKRRRILLDMHTLPRGYHIVRQALFILNGMFSLKRLRGMGQQIHLLEQPFLALPHVRQLQGDAPQTSQQMFRETSSATKVRAWRG